jgi:hypothetical protein
VAAWILTQYYGDSVDQTVRHALDVLYAAGIFSNVKGGSVDGRALALVESGDKVREPLRRSGGREYEPSPGNGAV